MSQKSAGFSKLRSFLWPIHGYELKKFLPMAMIMFSLLFNYTILRNMKDTLVINAVGAGVIPFLKLYCVTPSAILFFVLFVKLSNVFDREKVFYAVVLPFIGFFALFAFVIYPNLEFFHPSQETIASLSASYPSLQGFIDIYAYWSYSLFYILAELWGSVGIQILFWQFANQVVSMDDSKRFYPLFLTIGQAGLILCGIMADYLANGIKNILPEGANLWQVSLSVQMSAVFIMGLFAMGLNRFLSVKVLPLEEPTSGPKKEKKKKPGLVESLKLVFTSKHLMLIAVLVMAYGITINLVEVQWKNQVKIHFAGDKSAFNAFMNSYSSWTGIIGILFGWFAASGLLRKLSWFWAAVITPAIVLVGGTIFFTGILSGEALKAMAFNPVSVAVFSGVFVVAASKIVKYALFDSTKAQAYIPLDVELKTKGMAAVEVVGGRAGKAGGALVQTIMLMALATKDILLIAPYAAGIFIVIGILWIYAVKALSVKVSEALAAMKK